MNVDAEDEASDMKTSPSSPKRHDILWFPDGNVVLQTDTYLFRVHKSVLSLHSSVFKGMFELPTAEGGKSDDAMVDDAAGMEPELYEGVPLVVLVGDKGEDIAHVLRTVYDHGYVITFLKYEYYTNRGNISRYYISRSDDHPLGKITALLLLSTKYDFGSIRRDVIGHLLKHYPTTLSEFDAVDDDDATAFHDCRYSHHFELLKVALAAEADILLPGLFYACSDFTVSAILNVLGEMLDKQNIRKLLEGRDRLGIAMKRVQWVYLSESEHCVKLHGPSLNSVHPDRFRLKDPDPSSVFDEHALKDISGKILSSLWPNRFCQACKGRAEQRIEEEREKVWQELPTYFALSTWDVLRKTLE